MFKRSESWTSKHLSHYNTTPGFGLEISHLNHNTMGETIQVFFTSLGGLNPQNDSPHSWKQNPFNHDTHYLRGFYSKTTLMGQIFIDDLTLLHFIYFLSTHRRIIEGGNDVIFISTLCRQSSTLSHNFCSCPLIILQTHRSSSPLSLQKLISSLKGPKKIVVVSGTLSSTTNSCRS